MSALDDVRVLDLTRVLGGPYCTMLLADLGADVVKIEPPGGDFVRETPPFHDEDDSFGGYFQSINRGKRSLELDFTDEDDREDFLSLVDAADVVVENYRAGTMAKFDLEYERLAERNPQLVYAAMRGFGDPRTGESPKQDEPAFDLVAQAMGGVMHQTGQPDGPPTKVGFGVGDIFTGVLHAVNILAALHYRERTGVGQFVDTAMYDSMVSLAERAVYQYSYTGEVPKRNGNSHPTLFPYNAFEAEDGYVVIAALTDRHWQNLCEHMGKPEWAVDYADASDRLEHRDELREAIAAWVSSQSAADVLETLNGSVPCGPVQDVADIYDCEHAQQREMLVEADLPEADETVTIAGTPIKMAKTPPEPGDRAPLLDEHRDELLGVDIAQPPEPDVGDGETESFEVSQDQSQDD
ncbi:succinyl-CoA:mesaconate CoA-transferase [Halopiger aswanensis]|uniref:Succinyl-CoA:mesaconate CoA transferase n=1 Tax=Halopiger aswanensis TaxID=148449 RepID=A0A3R7KML1_9EURY|nr:succinyl-CoA:mesaconate CoA-transferase [Halopiger aswanensis]RKD97351.1 succinyl-CoA:mesaconate CoA transferase [Halopiger aswanensis]